MPQAVCQSPSSRHLSAILHILRLFSGTDRILCYMKKGLELQGCIWQQICYSDKRFFLLP